MIFQHAVACRLRSAAAGVARRAGEVWIPNVRGSVRYHRHMARRDSLPRFSSILGIRDPVLYSLTEIETESEMDIISLIETETEMFCKTETK